MSYGVGTARTDNAASEFLTTGFVRCTCHASIDISKVARNGKFGTCPTCSRLFDWPRRKVDRHAAARAQRKAQRSLFRGGWQT